MSNLYLNGLNPLIYSLSELNRWEGIYIVINKSYDWTDIYGSMIDQLPNMHTVKKIYYDDVNIIDYDTISSNLIYVLDKNKIYNKIISIYPEGLSSYKYLYDYKRFYMYLLSYKTRIHKLYIIPPRLYKNIDRHNITYTSRAFYETFKTLSKYIDHEYEDGYLHSYVGPTSTFDSMTRHEYSKWIEEIIDSIKPYTLYIKAKHYHEEDPIYKYIIKNYPVRTLEKEHNNYPAEAFYYKGLTKYVGYPSTINLNMNFQDILLLDSPNKKLNRHKRKASSAFLRYFQLVSKNITKFTI